MQGANLAYLAEHAKRAKGLLWAVVFGFWFGAQGAGEDEQGEPPQERGPAEA